MTPEGDATSYDKNRTWKTSIRIILPVFLTVALFAFSVFFIFIPSLERQMMAEKRSMIRSLADSVWSLLAEYDRTASDGQSSRENAQQQAIKRIREMRYGPQGKDYFWINDMTPRMIMHPYRSDLEGQDLSNYTDPNGKPLFKDTVKIVRDRGAGYLNYMWQRMDDPQQIIPKLSYVRLFKPWGWVIGTGIYIKDVKKEIALIKERLTLIFLGVLALVSALLLYVLGRTVKSEKGQIRAQKQLIQNEKKYMNLYEESKKREALYESLLGSSADAVVTYDLQGRAQYVSPVFTDIFGWTTEEVKGGEIPFLPESEKEETLAIIRDLVENGTPCHGYETKRFKKDGEILDVSISASRYNDHEGNPSGMLVLLRDISERKHLEVQIQQAQRIESIGTLAGGTAHNFNNLLMAIQGNASLMRMDKGPDDPDYERLQNIEKYVKDGSTLAQELLGFARGGKYEIQPADLNELVQKSSKMFGSARKEIAIETDYQADIWLVEADHGQIEQVLLNMYVNGWQAMREAGKLCIKTENVYLDRSVANRHGVSPGPYVRITITDTGEGMDRDTLERIFDPFFTTKDVGQGTGLGLSSAYGIIKNHKGFIEVQSTPGKGSTFTISIPANPSKKNLEVRPPKTEDHMVKGAGTIMLVDDEMTVLEVGKDMIEYLGYTALVATSGKEALANYKDRKGQIDLIILDMVMPGMGGSDTYKKLKSTDPTVKVLLSSGYSIDGEATQILNEGCNGFIKKPFNLNELSTKIQSILHDASEQVRPI